MSKGKIVIFDGCFYFKEQIEHLEKNLELKSYIFNLKAPLGTCIARDSKRKRVYGEKATREVYGLVSKFNYGINIYTNKKTKNQLVKEIMSYLSKK